jgi:hypothetical protein
VTAAAPGRVLRLSLLAWGLGDLVAGRRYAGSSWLLAEAIGLGTVALATWLFADTTWYLLPFVLGMAFLAAWGAQAIRAYHRAQRFAGQATPPTSRRSPAAAAAWLTLPLLAWGTGFWLIGGTGSSPAAVTDRFLSGWADATAGSMPAAWGPDLATNPAALSAAAVTATARLRELCAAGTLPSDCADDAANLLRDVRIRLETVGADRATAVAELVRFERRPTRVLGLFDATELAPVALEEILRLDLAARPAAIGAQRWAVVAATVP